MNISELKIVEALWTKVFPKDAFIVKDNSRLEVVTSFSKHFKSNQQIFNDIKLSTGTVTFEVSQLQSLLSYHDFEISLINQPIELLGCLSISLSLIATTMPKDVNSVADLNSSDIKIIHPKITKLSQGTKFSDLKSSKVGQLISLKGYVVKCSSIKPLVQSAFFSCSKCFSSQETILQDGVYIPPEKCAEAK